MMNRPDLDQWIAGWRGPILAALLAVLAGLPGLLLAPVLDREETRVAQGTAQMIESGDLVDIRFQDERRYREPPGANWMQAVAVQATGGPEARDIRAYRLPSLLGAALAAAACAWAAGALFGSRAGFLAGALMASTFLLSSEAGIAKTDALLCGLITLAMAALGQIYVRLRDERRVGRRLKLIFWSAAAAAILVGGLTAPFIIGLTLLTLCVADRRVAWLGRLGWGWGLPLTALIVGPWAIAVTIGTDGGFWRGYLAENPLWAALNGREDWGLPGAYLLSAPLMLFPVILILPAALVAAWTRRHEPPIRFAAAWLIPAWVALEIGPGSQWHEVLPLFGAIAWLASAALQRPMGRVPYLAGTALAVVGGVFVTIATLYALSEFGGESAHVWATPTIGLTLAAAGIGGFLMFHRLAIPAVAASIVLGVLAHGALAGVARNLQPLWVSNHIADELLDAGAHPVAGRLPGPVAVTGYSQPSIVFLLGSETELTDGRGAARAIAQNRPAAVEQADEADFRAALASFGESPVTIGEVTGINYSNGDRVTLTLYRPEWPGATPGGRP
ncbi:ArnT family glycosyltransferase [Brevundimonas lutea]|uniref:ArnT family glycosyltransferase n=1 Tax=Brevundimonas lutea TaxID=2293980 RepID=UPI001F0C403C|nr:phospholipid carrier-dependent glycosyltransferase [Brevundimonas lutea]